MLDEVYRVIKYGTLDQLFESRAKCFRVIIGCYGLDVPRLYRNYLRTALKHLPLYNEEIAKRREKGELTMQEQLYEITGNVFTICRSGR